jgi:hypothetical protein
MAAAPIFTDQTTPEADKIVPLAMDYIPGSTQQYGVTASSLQFPMPVFYAPHGREGLINYWGSLISGKVLTYYARVSPRAENPVAFDRLNLELMRIASLDPNWDGEGADAISQEAANNASRLITLAREAIEHSPIIEIPMPSLVPSVDGAVVLRWIRAGKELKCTVFGDRVEVIRWRSQEQYESDGFWEVPIDHVAEHFSWLLE